MAQLINAETGALEDVPEAQVPQAFLSRKYNLQPAPLPVKSPTGVIGTIQPEDAAEAFHNGYVPVTQEEHDAAADQVKFGEGFGNAARAFIGEAGSSATLGLSDLAERALMPDLAAEESKVRKYNPGSTLAGGLTGGAALVAATGGLGAAAEGAEGAEAATGIAGKLGQLGTRLAKDAAYGGAFGAGQSISEAALGDHELTAEHMLSEMGNGMLLGGATGLGLWGAGKVLSPVLERAQGALGKVSDYLSSKAEGWDKGKIANREVEKFTGALDDALQGGRDIGSEMRGDDGLREQEARSGLIDPKKTPLDPIKNDITSRITDAQDAVNKMSAENAAAKEAGEGPKYTDSMLAKARGVLSSLASDVDEAENPYDVRTAVRGAVKSLGAKSSFGKVFGDTESADTAGAIKDIWGSFREHLTSEDLYGSQGAREKAIRAAESTIADKSWAGQDSPVVKAFRKEFGYSGSKQLETDPGKVMRFMKWSAAGDPRAAPMQEALNGMLSGLKSYSDEAATSFKNVPGNLDLSSYQNLAAHQSDVLSGLKPQAEAGAAAFKAATAQESSLPALLAKGVAKVPVVGELGAHVVENPGTALETLSKFADLSKRATSKIRNGVRAFLRGTGTTGSPIFSDDVLRQARFASGTSGEDDLEKRTKEIDQYAGNPEALNQKLSAALEPIHDHAPKVAEAMAAKASAQFAYLQSVAPRDPSAQFAVGPSPKHFTGSHAQRREFAGAIEGATDPTGFLNRAMKTGMVNKSGLAALRATNPKIYDQWTDHVMNESSKLKRPLSYAQKLTLSRLTGAPFSISMTPAGVASLQAGFAGAGPGKSAGATPRSPHAASSKMDLAKGLEPREAHLGKGP